MNPRMLTLFTDASFSDGACGWGAWAKKSGWESGITFGGLFPAEWKVNSHNQTEIAAIAAGLSHLREQAKFGDTDQVMIQSDSTHALGVILFRLADLCVGFSRHRDGVYVHPAKSTTDKQNALCEIIREVVLEQDCKLIVRHVKGHKAGGGRQWVNRECDRIAKKYRKQHAEMLSQNPLTLE